MNGKKMFFGSVFSALAVGALFLPQVGMLSAQEANPTAKTQPDPSGVTRNGDIFFYKVNVVQRDLDAVNYLHRTGQTQLRFQGTTLMPAAKGEAVVKSERGGITISAKFEGLTPANGFGKEYLTYVLWAISSDGSPRNLGEVLPAGTKSNIDVTTSLQAFGLIVTAEPYYSVTTPSDVVVIQGVAVEDRTNGVLEKVQAHYTLLPRGNYADTEGAHTVENPITRNERSPLELYEAYNAVRIAKKAGAEKYTPDIYAKAMESLHNAADIDANKKGDRKLEITFARGAVQSAEDARVSTLRKEATEREQNAVDARRTAEMQAQQSQLDAAKADAAKAQADAARMKAEAEAAEARANAAQANKSADDANAVRERLKAQLNSVLATSESARGLIVNMSDVLFDSGKYTLKPGTQISLAKVAGILQAYPGLKLQVEGFTDSVGGDDYNQKLSENRAGAVKDFLVTQGVSVGNITAKGYGKNNPVADNGTAAGKALNRRVNLVVSGDAIGVQQTAGPAAQ